MGGTDLELAKAVVEAAGTGCRVTIAGGVTTRGGDPRARRDRRRRPGRHGALHRPARPRRRDHGAAGHRPAGRALSHRRGRRARRVPGPRLLVAGIDPRGGAAADGHLPVAQRAACGSRARPAAPPRSCCASTSTAIATALASSCASAGPGFCHLDTRTCWGEDAGLGRLRPHAGRARASRRRRAATRPSCSPIPALLGAKLREEADELAEAETREHVIWEAADVLYFTLARLAARGHRAGRGRGASRPAGAQGHAARMRLLGANGAGPDRRADPGAARPCLAAADCRRAVAVRRGGRRGARGRAVQARSGDPAAVPRARRSGGADGAALAGVRRCATSLRWAGHDHHHGDAGHRRLPAHVRQAAAALFVLVVDPGRRHCSASRSRPASSGRGPSCCRMASRSTRRASPAAMPPGPPPPT